MAATAPMSWLLHSDGLAKACAEFALSHATGDYVTFLCDDDAFSPRLLSAVDAVIRGRGVEVVCWRRQTYVHPSWYVPEQRNILQYTRTTGGVTMYDSRVALMNLK